MLSTPVRLRCDRCAHHFSHHGSQGCLVCKVRWDDNLRALTTGERCPCAWYVGEMPPKENPDDCPHEIQVDLDGTTCIHCRKKVTPVS